MPSSDKARIIEIDATESNLHADYLSELEQQLKELWSRYIAHLENQGHDENAMALRDRYFNLYRYYRHNKHWKRTLANKQ